MTRSLWSLQNCSSSPIEVSLMYSILFIAVILLILIIILQTWAAKTCKKKMPQNALKLIILFISLCHEEAMCSIINKLWIKPRYLTKAGHVPVLCKLLYWLLTWYESFDHLSHLLHRVDHPWACLTVDYGHCWKWRVISQNFLYPFNTDFAVFRKSFQFIGNLQRLTNFPHPFTIGAIL